jgi:hypothetical protein
MSSSRKIDLQRYFAAGVYLSEAPSPPMTPYTLHIVYVYTVYIFTQGRGEGGEMKVIGATGHKAGYLQSIKL